MTDTIIDRSPRAIPGNITSPGALTGIITGNFEHQLDAQEGLADLYEAGFAKDQLAMFPVGAAAESDSSQDRSKSPTEHHAAADTGSSGVLVGAIGAAAVVAAAPALGPAAGAIAGVGASFGAFVDAVAGAEHDDAKAEQPSDAPTAHPSPRRSGTLIAVSAPTMEQQRRAVEILRAHGGAEIECTEGSIVDGRWIDFDPKVPPLLVE
ncbi:hypothetical protein [Nevskia ramosa]|uniref:hypothetical protein n=1 Tax=Nevskia ramosa TaxID=64002 RepID=UPI0003B417C4|nr:hypothetical protein [Nevskia ramosa]